MSPRDLSKPYFYLLRRLGRPQQRKPDEISNLDYADYEVWREGVAHRDTGYASVPESQVRDRLLGKIIQRQQHLILITGEPGSGKSSLLEAWLGHWEKNDTIAHLGQEVPALVLLRDLDATTFAVRRPDRFADHLWEARRLSSLSSGDLPVWAWAYGRLWRPIWLLDELDEVPSAVLTSDFIERLSRLPGPVCLTCRTAVAQAEARILRDYVAPQNHFELLPLNDTEQTSYLAHCFGGDAKRAATLQCYLRTNPQLRELAGSPLLLSLIAEFGELSLPTRRSSFYRDVVAELWRSRSDPEMQQRLRPYRDPVLTALAAKMRLERIVVPIDLLDGAFDSACVDDRGSMLQVLKNAGLLRVEREKVEFLHLALQEFYLARHLATGPFSETLEQLWVQPRYDETLALLTVILVDAGRVDEVDHALTCFVIGKLETHANDPKLLWRLGRSPLRSVMHILARGGIELRILARLSKEVRKLAAAAMLFRFAFAYDRRSPRDALATLARDQDLEVRIGVAMNSATPAEALAVLARDELPDIRAAVAMNSAAPAEALAVLAYDKDPKVRRVVASISAAPAAILTALARDKNPVMRMGVAMNSAAPAAILTALARDKDPRVRLFITLNSAAPAEALAILARDKKPDIRAAVAKNSAVSAEILAVLARDKNPAVRQAVAGISAAPAAILTALACDKNSTVRWIVATNSAASAEALAILARDKRPDIRTAVAGFSATPAEILAILAHDKNRMVRWAVAGHSAAPAEILAGLARDKDPKVRWMITRASAAPAEILAGLLADLLDYNEGDPEVRWAVAMNSTMATEISTILARDEDPDLRAAVAKNTATPAEALAILARDKKPDIRAAVAKNSAASAEILAVLARDKNSDVRAAVARNRAASAETLATLVRDKNSKVHVAAAMNSSLILEDLLQSPFVAVQRR